MRFAVKRRVLLVGLSGLGCAIFRAVPATVGVYVTDAVIRRLGSCERDVTRRGKLYEDW